MLLKKGRRSQNVLEKLSKQRLRSSVCFFIYLRLALMRRNQCLVVQGLDTNHQIRRKSEVYDHCIKERRSMLARLHPDVYAQHL